MKSYQQLGAIITMILSGSSFAHAADLYNNLPAPPLSPFSFTNGLTLYNGDSLANEFTTGANLNGYTLGNVFVDIDSPYSDSTVGIELQVFTDSTSNPGSPGSLVLTLQDPANISTSAAYDQFSIPTSIPSGQTGNLAANSNYWVVITNNSQNTLDWLANESVKNTISGQPDQLYGNGPDYGGIPFSNYGLLMDVQATPIPGTGPTAAPLPASVWMMGSALIGLFSSLNRKSKK